MIHQIAALWVLCTVVPAPSNPTATPTPAYACSTAATTRDQCIAQRQPNQICMPAP